MKSHAMADELSNRQLTDPVGLGIHCLNTNRCNDGHRASASGYRLFVTRASEIGRLES
jgi:hypothetical protein